MSKSDKVVCYASIPLAGKAHILKPVNSYMKNKIDFLLLLNARIIIAGEEWVVGNGGRCR